jgi:hypothetical protein
MFILTVLLCSVGQAQNTTIFGSNVYVFDNTFPDATIQTDLNNLSNEVQFSTNRYAVLFKPGTYNVEAGVGYYEQIAGLGTSPSGVTINGYLSPDVATPWNGSYTYFNYDLTSYFWRSIENMAINPATDSAQEGGLNTLLWGVSQGTPVRRVQINGDLELTNSWCGNSSGGFISDTVVTGQVSSCSQQQWYTRNSNFGSWTGSNWNMVFSGVVGAPIADYPPSSSANSNADTVLTSTPVSREKPFLYIDSNGNYDIFVPQLRTNSTDVSWSSSMGTGYSIQITNGSALTGNVLIAGPTTPLATINAALAAGESLILTPGMYGYAGPINVTQPNTIVLGLGYATLIPTSGTAAITVADVDGVQIAGLIIDAGPVNSPVLLQVGTPGAARANHAANPTSINDVDIRIGGGEVGAATTAIEIDSNNVILDDIWSWRADHGAGAGWTSNPSNHGLVVNGDDVTALGLAVEHYQKEQVLWNGQGGETIFYESELPYDPPSQIAWMDGSIAGYPSYVVIDGVATHQAYGLGVYSYFDQGVNIVDSTAISVPNAPGVSVTDAVTVFLSGSGSITHTVNNVGTVVQGPNVETSYVPYYSYVPCTANCPTAPAPPTGLTATVVTATNQINLNWTASPTAGVTYNVYRNQTSGFTPSDNYIVGADLSATTFLDATVSGSTKYYYVVEAVNAVGASAPTAQAAATTYSSNTCYAAPSQPATVLSEAIASNQNMVTWDPSTAPSACSVTYTVYRGRNASQGPFAPPMQIATGLKVTSYTDSGLTNPATYYYTVKAADASGSSALTSAQQSTALAAYWTLAWGDDFTGAANTSYNPANWTPDVVDNTGNNPFGDGTIMSTTSSLQNAYLDGNGDLVVAMTYDAANGTYDSARLISASPVGPYGRIEARIMNPSAQGMGAAFWALGSDYWSASNPVAWPWCGELDMMEAQAANPGQGGSTIHGGETDTGTNYEYGGLSVPYSLPNGETFSQGFHTYAVQWAPYHIQYFLDGVQYGDVAMANLSAADVWPMNESINFILSSGVGGNGGMPDGIGFPSNLTFDYVHYYQWAAGAPGPVTGLTAVANYSNAVNLNWTASATSGVTYNIYASTTQGTAPSPATLVVEQVSATAYQHTGLQPNTTYYYTVVASNWGGESTASNASAKTMPAGNSTGLQLSAGGYAAGTYAASNFVVGGNTNYHLDNVVNTAQVTNPAPQLVYDTERWGPAAWTITGLTPGAGYNVRLHFVEATHTAAGQRAFNVSINSENVLTNFDIFATAGAMNTAVTQEFYTLADEGGIIELQTAMGTNGDGDLNPTVSAIEIIPANTSTAASGIIGAAPGTTVDLAINSGGAAVSDFVADEDFNGGIASSATNTINVNTPNAAPAAVYQTQRYSPFTYVLTGLVKDAAYTVNLHFAETYWTKVGQRVFNVALNGTTVLPNFDVFRLAGANTALVETFSATADMYGQIIVQLIGGSADQPFISGIEAVQQGSAIGSPTTLAVSATTSGDNLSWNASSSAGVTYSVYRFTTGAATVLASGLTTTTYPDTAVTNGTSYTYYVVATNGALVSPASNSVTVVAAIAACTANCPTDVLAINGGGATIASPSTTGIGWSADTDFDNNGSFATGDAIDVSLISNPAPQAVYQTMHTGGTFTYTIPSLTAGTVYGVVLQFAELWYTTPGHRIFDVSINGVPVLNNFDIVATTGAGRKAIAYQFNAPANSNGNIVISFAASADGAQVNAIEIVANPAPAIPVPASNLTATALASNNQVQLNWLPTLDPSATYSVYGGTTPNFAITAANLIASGLTTTTTTITEPAAATTYYYQIVAVTGAGSSMPSTMASATTAGCTSSTCADVIAINSGYSGATNYPGTATSSSFIPDPATDYSGGMNSNSTGNTINVTNVVNAAPMAVYQTAHQGTFSYTIPNLTAGQTYNVRLHFAELWTSSPGVRQFDVSINGTQVLTNFDIVATAQANFGLPASAAGNFLPVVEQFPATANSSGQIVVSFSNGAQNSPQMNGIEVF